jgi:ribosomal protein S18 acetylase RimI-like enzyme
VIVRRATEQDEAGLRTLWEAFEAEVPEPAGFEPEPWEEQWGALRPSIDGGAVYVAEDEEELVAVVHVLAPERGVAHVEWAHVQRDFRRQGVVKELLRECVREVKARGAKTVSLEALRTNEPALTVWRRLGFEVVEFFMATPLEELEKRLGAAVLHEDKGFLHDRVVTAKLPSSPASLAKPPR